MILRNLTFRPVFSNYHEHLRQTFGDSLRSDKLRGVNYQISAFQTIVTRKVPWNIIRTPPGKNYTHLDWLFALISSFIFFFFSSVATLDQEMIEPLFLDKNALWHNMNSVRRAFGNHKLVTIQSPDGLNSILPFRHLTKKNATVVKLVKIKFFVV